MTTKKPDTDPMEDFINEVVRVKDEVREAWVAGYQHGYREGRDGERKRVNEIIEKYLKGEEV